jgi:hypothetical protein
MTLRDLGLRFRREGVEPALYHIGDGWQCIDDAFALVRDGDAYEIFYTERGLRGSAHGRYATEAEACEAYHALVTSMQATRLYLIAFVSDRARADAVAAVLDAHSVPHHRDSILYRGPADWRFRVLVRGPNARAAAQQALGTDLPIRDTPA